MNSGDHDEDDNQVSSFEVPEMDSNQAPSESCQQVPIPGEEAEEEDMEGILDVHGDTPDPGPDIGLEEETELCDICVHRPCLCMLLKLELKIKILEEGRRVGRMKEEDDDHKKKTSQEDQEDEKLTTPEDPGRNFKVGVGGGGDATQIPSLGLDCTHPTQHPVPPKPVLAKHSAVNLHSTLGVRKKDGQNYKIVQEILNELIISSMQTSKVNSKEDISKGARPKIKLKPPKSSPVASNKVKIMPTKPNIVTNSGDKAKTNKPVSILAYVEHTIH